jgi:NAD(P)-dependent dehydrogenase (short-subunit alcohol dehydrogenase family)
VSDLGFDGRVAVVTGAGTERGKSVALVLAGRGAHVVVNDVRASEAACVAKLIEDRGGTAMPNSDGVDSPESGQAIVDAALEAFGGLDVVVHYTERPTDATSAQEMLTDADPEELVAGMFGGYWLARAAFAHMRQRRFGRIVVGCTLDGSIADGLDEGNGVAGMGLVGLMNIVKVEGAEHDVKVNMVVPTAAADPAVISHAVAYLAHEGCAPTGEIFVVRPDGLARLFIGVTEGYFDPDLTSETFRDRVGEFLDPDGFFVPQEASGEITLLKRDLSLL